MVKGSNLMKMGSAMLVNGRMGEKMGLVDYS